MRRTLMSFLLAGSATALLLAPAHRATAQTALPKPVPCNDCWEPSGRVSWQWQLQGKIDLSIHAAIYDVDLFDTKKATVRALHRRGRRAVCYLDAGTWEDWRPDAASFPKRVLGRSNGWPGERWLDIRRRHVLAPIMRSRLDRCARKGFDGVELDNVDGYANRTGFHLTAHQQLVYNAWLANQAHRRGLSAALKNDLDQVARLLPYFDYALDEQCFQYRECVKLKPFVSTGKTVLEVEYRLERSKFCSRAGSLGFSSMRKRLGLGPWRAPCR